MAEPAQAPTPYRYKGTRTFNSTVHAPPGATPAEQQARSYHRLLDHHSLLAFINHVHECCNYKCKTKDYLKLSTNIPAVLPPYVARTYGGHQKRYDWSQRMVCTAAGLYIPLPQGQRKRRGKGSITARCPAVYRVRKVIGQYYYVVDYSWNHDSHDPTSLKEFQMMRPSRQTTEHVRSALAGGVPRETVLLQNRLDNTTIEQVCRFRFLSLLSRADLPFPRRIENNPSSLASVPACARINQQVVYNISRQLDVAKARLSSDAMESLRRHGVNLEEEGWSVRLNEHEPTSDRNDTFSWSLMLQSKFQKEKLAALDPGTMFFMDSTHDTCYGPAGKDEKVMLTTVVTKDVVTGGGLPLAFLFTPIETAVVFEAFLRWIHHQVPSFIPRQFMIDCSATEARAITSVFPEARIFYCAWHFDRACKGQITRKIDDVERRKQATQWIYRLRKSESVADFDAWLAFIRQQFYGTAFIDYFERQWVTCCDRWAGPWRVDAWQDIHTNNYTEGFHSKIKDHDINTPRQQRIDHIVERLASVIMPGYRQHHAMVRAGLQPRKQDKAETKRAQLAAAVPAVDAMKLVRRGPQNEIYVASFSGQPVFHRISFNIGSNNQQHVAGCTCPDYRRHALPCKHMHLASRVLGVAISYTSSLATLSPPPLNPPPAAAPPPSHAVSAETERTMREAVQTARALTMALEEQLARAERGGFDTVPLPAFSTALSNALSAHMAVKTAYRAVGQPQRR